ncbi:hypothetical protein HHI36_007351 [Cryptolaemus montrouzieri]|uniref:DDE-1 domain-containing protein n=1 Tax=Cryptolaemus montrouzieri TaxID=559131 RepID=A0ABD2MPJ8_9CUCU
MVQSVIETFKQLYRKQLLRRLLSVEEGNELKEGCYMVVDAWDLIERNTSNKAWNRVLNQENVNSITNTDDSILEDMNEINEQQEMQEDETEENIDVEHDTGPFHDVVFHDLETALKWFEKQRVIL